MVKIEDIFSFILFATALAACFICICSAILSGDGILLAIAAIVILYIFMAYVVAEAIMK